MSKLRGFWDDVVAPAYEEAKQDVTETYEEAKQDVTETYQEAKQEVTETYEEAKQEVTETYEDAKQWGTETYEEAKQEVAEAYEDAKQAVPEAGGGGPADKAALEDMVRAEFGKQIDAKVTAASTGVIGELNNLENYRDTNVTVPEVAASEFADVSASELDKQIKASEFTIAQTEAARVEICKKARADGRLAVSNAKKEMTVGIVTPTIVGTVAGALAGSPALGALAGLVGGIVGQYHVYGNLLDTLKATVEKAKSDLRPLNTTAEAENKKLAAMKEARKSAPAKDGGNQPIDLGEIDIPQPRDLGDIDAPEPRDLGDIDAPEPRDLGDIDVPRR